MPVYEDRLKALISFVMVRVGGGPVQGDLMDWGVQLNNGRLPTLEDVGHLAVQSRRALAPWVRPTEIEVAIILRNARRLSESRVDRMGIRQPAEIAIDLYGELLRRADDPDVLAPARRPIT